MKTLSPALASHAADARADVHAAAPTRASLARRIASWTSRGALTALILAVGLAFGRQVEDWWAADQSANELLEPSAVFVPRIEPALPYSIQFGDSVWSLHHQVVVGSRDVMLQTLRAECRRIAGGASTIPASASASELRFVASLAGRQPCEEQAGRWALYEYGDSLPLVVATQWRGPSLKSAPAPNQVSGERRVVGWGMGVPRGQAAWTVYLFGLASADPDASDALRNMPLLPGSRRELCVRMEHGGSMMSFRGPADERAWCACVAEWLRKQGGQVLQAGPTAEGPWQLSGVLGRGAAAVRVDLQFVPADAASNGEIQGLMWCTPGPPTSGSHDRKGESG